MDRITRRDLDGVCRVLNRRAGFPDGTELWTRADGQNRATVGMFYIDGAYGGWALYLTVSEGGGVSDVFRCGHVPARELYGLLRAFLDGWEYVERRQAGKEVGSP